MCLEHCQAPDEWQHRQAKAAQRPGHFEPPPIWTRPPFDLDAHVQVAKMQLQWHIDTLAEQVKEAIFWRCNQ